MTINFEIAFDHLNISGAFQFSIEKYTAHMKHESFDLRELDVDDKYNIR